MMIAAFTLVVAALAHASEPKATPSPAFSMAERIYLKIKVLDQNTRFILVPKRSLTISHDCLKDDQFQCKAYEVFMNAKLPKKKDLKKGKSAGEVMCSTEGGAVLMGTDESGNKHSYCRFKDESLISTSSMHSEALDRILKKRFSPKK